MLVGPLLVCFVFGLLGLALSAKPVTWYRRIGVLSPLLHLGFTLKILVTVNDFGIQSLQLGGWKSPFGISFVVDTLGALLLTVTSVIYLAGYLFAVEEVEDQQAKQGFFSLLHFLMMGVTGAFATGDYFNMYVWYEVMILSSFGLLVIGQQKFLIEGAFKYAVLNFLASTFFLMGLGLLYGSVGSLNIADVTLKLQSVEVAQAAWPAGFMIAIGFAIKAGVFPFYSWLPTVYHLPTFTASAVFAGLLTKVGVYSLFRLLGMSFALKAGDISSFFTVIAILTMILGVFGAASQFNIRRILSFHIISQIGYIILGLALFTEQAFAAATFYLIHHIIVKTNLFFIAGLVDQKLNSEDLKFSGDGLIKLPWLALVFIISGFSLGGIPPLSGFFAKYAILKESLTVQSYWVLGVGIFVGWLTLFSMTKIWSEAFWKPQIQVNATKANPIIFLRRFVVTGLALVTLWISFFPDPLMKLSQRVGKELLNPQSYIESQLKLGEVK